MSSGRELVPFNPCGRITDYARREYRTAVRFFADSLLEVDVQVYRAEVGAPDLGRESSFMSLDWLDPQYDGDLFEGVGEVEGAPRPYSFHGALIGADYAHVCGTDQEFRRGAQFDPTIDVKYDEQGIPLCCGLPWTPFFGLVLGFDATIVDIAPTNCPAALVLEEDTPTEALLPGAGTYWFNMPWVPNDVIAKVVTESVNGNLDAATAVVMFTGLACSLGGPIASGVIDECVSWINPSGAAGRYVVVTVPSGSGVLRLTGSLGACP